MAIATDANLGTNSSPSTSATLTTSAAAASGSRIVVFLEWYSDTETVTGASGGGLTWVVEAQQKHPDNGWRVAILTADAPSGLASSTTITPTYSSGGGTLIDCAIAAQSFTGLATGASGYLTGTPIGSTGYDENWVTGNITTTDADALLLVAHMAPAPTTQAGSDINAPATGLHGIYLSGDGDPALTTGYRIVSSTGTYSIDGDSTVAVYLEGDVLVAIKAAVTNQFAYAAADSVDGTWTDQAAGTSLAAAIDETSASDADYIRSVLAPSNSGCRVKLGSLTAPQAGTRTLHWRTGKDVTGGGQINMTVRLRQGGGDSLGGGTLVDEFTRNNVDSATTYDETVAGTITDYTDLYLEFYANQV